MTNRRRRREAGLRSSLPSAGICSCREPPDWRVGAGGTTHSTILSAAILKRLFRVSIKCSTWLTGRDCPAAWWVRVGGPKAAGRPSSPWSDQELHPRTRRRVTIRSSCRLPGVILGPRSGTFGQLTGERDDSRQCRGPNLAQARGHLWLLDRQGDGASGSSLAPLLRSGASACQRPDRAPSLSLLHLGRSVSTPATWDIDPYARVARKIRRSGRLQFPLRHQGGRHDVPPGTGRATLWDRSTVPGRLGQLVQSDPVEVRDGAKGLRRPSRIDAVRLYPGTVESRGAARLHSKLSCVEDGEPNAEAAG